MSSRAEARDLLELRVAQSGHEHWTGDPSSLPLLGMPSNEESDMSVQHLTIDDTRAWFQASDRQVFIGDVMDLATSATTRVRFARYGKGAVHEWMVTVDETLIVTKGALLVRSEGSVQIARAGEVISLAKGTRVVYRGEDRKSTRLNSSH